MEISEVKQIWEKVKEELESIVPESTFEPWIKPLVPISYENGVFTLLTGHSIARQFIKNQNSDIIETFKKNLNDFIKYEIIYDEKLKEKFEKEEQKEKRKIEKAKADALPDSLSTMRSTNLNLKFKFENFVVGPNSEIVFKAAQQVAKNPAQKYNPLFIYGNSGLGKTHLLQAIGHYVIFNNPKLKVKYVKTEEYVNDYILNANQKTTDRTLNMDKFRRRYSNVDILLVDDIQFLESKGKSIDAFFQTFDALYNKSKQIVIASDRPPKEIPTLPERLVSRFERGLTLEITPPDFETRTKILKNMAILDNFTLQNDVISLIATNFKKNVRELEGAYNKLNAYANLMNTKIDVANATEILNINSSHKEITIETITDVICEKFNVTLKELQSSSRQQGISYPRQLAIYLAREILDLSYKEIATFFKKQHPTILFHYEKIRDNRKLKPELNNSLSELERRIKENE
ncbi:MAG: chromosomal replication initiator protein DnaA [bacterium]|nr:chromosomal replication initiator protein DnaA [bacterium]